jgi:hypothetical protein
MASKPRCLGAHFPTSRSIGEPFADYAAKRAIGAFSVIDAERNAVVMPEIEFGEVAMQMFLADVLIDTVDPSLQDRKVPFSSIGVGIASYIFVLGMNDCLVAGEFLADLPIDAALVCSEVRCFVDSSFKDRPQGRRGHFRDVIRANAALAFYQGNNGFLGCWSPIGPISGFAADESLIRLDEHSFAAEWAGVINTEIRHRLTDAMRQEPCGLQGDAEDAVQLVGAHALLAGTEQMHRLEPHMQLHMARLKDSTDLDGERLAAGVALVDANAGALALQRPALIDDAAVRAWPAVGPQSPLDKPISGFFAVEMCGRKDGWHAVSP